MRWSTPFFPRVQHLPLLCVLPVQERFPSIIKCSVFSTSQARVLHLNWCNCWRVYTGFPPVCLAGLLLRFWTARLEGGGDIHLTPLVDSGRCNAPPEISSGKNDPTLDKKVCSRIHIRQSKSRLLFYFFQKLRDMHLLLWWHCVFVEFDARTHFQNIVKIVL